MISFLLLTGALTALVLWMVIAGLRKPGAATSAEQQQSLNVAIAREHLANLRLEHESGELDDAQFARAREELERALAEDVSQAAPEHAAAREVRWLPAALAICIPVLAFALYWTLGTPAALNRSTPAMIAGEHPATSPAPPVDAASGQELPSVEVMIQRLEERLRREPDDPDGWYMLGRSRMAFDRHAEAAQAFEKSLALTGDKPEVMLAYADALAMSQGGSVSGRPFSVIKRALLIAPDNVTALWLGGMGYAEAGDFNKALELWLRLEPILAGEPDSQNKVRGLINLARERLSGENVPAINSGPVAASEAAPNTDSNSGANSASNINSDTGAIKLTVAIDPQVRAKVSDTDTVFVFARALNGPRMPLAVVRQPVSAFPLDVVLDDSQAMTPTARLSSFREVRVGARISISGSPMAQAGDWQSEPRQVGEDRSVTVQLLIDKPYQP